MHLQNESISVSGVGPEYLLPPPLSAKRFVIFSQDTRAEAAPNAVELLVKTVWSAVKYSLNICIRHSFIHASVSQ